MSHLRHGAVPFRGAIAMRTRKVSRAALLTLVGLLAILATTATPAAGRGSDGPPWCMSCPIFTERAGVDLVLNVLLYVPIGAGLALLRCGPGHVAWIAFAIAGVIETLQVNVIPGRFASITDVIANTSGALLGWAAIRHWRALLEPTRSRSRLFAILAGALALAVLQLTMWAQQEVPMSGAMSTLWRPSPARAADDVAHANGAGARIAYVTLDGQRHAGRLKLTPNELARLAGRTGYGLEMGFVSATRPADEDPAFELRDGEGRRVLRVRQDGRHLAADLATRGRLLRLRTPTVRLRRFFPSRAERVQQRGLDTVHVAVRVAQGNLSMHARLGTNQASGEHRRGAFAGWSLLISQSNSPTRVRILTFCWVVALILPPVYWAVLGMPPARPRTPDGRVGGLRARGIRFPPLVLAGFLAILLVLALEVLPRANGMEPAGLVDGTAAAVAIAAGGHIALRTARRRARDVAATRA